MYRALKRTKGYNTFKDVRPTLRNKPSGLKSDWRRTVSGPSTSHHQALVVHAQPRSTSMSPAVSRSLSHRQTPIVHAQPRSTSTSPVVSHSLSHRQTLIVDTRPSSLSTSTSPTVSHSSLPDCDHTSSLLAMSPPPTFSKVPSPPSHGRLVPLIDKKLGHDHARPSAVCDFTITAHKSGLTLFL